jgi:pilus assembly protein Flp/PilA
MLTALKNFAQDESGATAIEYGLLTGLLAIGVSAFASMFGGSMHETFAKVSTQLLSTIPHAGVEVVPPNPA